MEGNQYTTRKTILLFPKVNSPTITLEVVFSVKMTQFKKAFHDRNFQTKIGLFMALGIYQVMYSDRKFCRSICLSVGPGFASLGTSRSARTIKFGRRIRDQTR